MMNHTDMVYKKFIFSILFYSISLLCGCAFRPAKFIDTSLLTTEDRLTLNQKVFNKVWNLVNSKYYDPTFKGKDWGALGEKYRDEAFSANDNKTLYATINKMLGELGGSHLKAHMIGRFEDNYKDYQKPISAGFMWKIFENRAVVIKVFPESLAEKAGVKRGGF
jgi:carboxyl-terminal processing protease